MVRNNKNTPTLGLGISLAELMIVVSIIAIIASAAAIKFNNSIEYAQLQQATDTLLTDLHLVRNQAQQDQQPYSLQINIDSRSYNAARVPSLDKPVDIAVNLGAPPYNITALSTNLPEGNIVTFNPDGTAPRTGTIILNRGTKQMAIENQGTRTN